MSRTRTLTVSLAALTLALVAVAARPAAPAPAAGAAAAPQDQPPTLEDCMGGIKNALKALGSTVTDPARDEATLSSITRMQTWALTAKQMTPHSVEDQPEDQREAFVKGYRTQMARLLVEISQLEIDVLAGRHEAAGKRVAGNLLELRNDSHEIYQ